MPNFTFLGQKKNMRFQPIPRQVRALPVIEFTSNWLNKLQPRSQGPEFTFDYNNCTRIKLLVHVSSQNCRVMVKEFKVAWDFRRD
jgi:hypothetical protein